MKKGLVAIVGMCLISMFVLCAAYAEEKFGFVDLSRVFDGYQKTQDYDAKLQEKQGDKGKDRDKVVEEIKSLQNKLPSLNDAEKEKSQGVIDTKIKALQESDRQVQTDLRAEHDKMLTEILKEIEAAVREYAQKEGYTMILNDRFLLYGKQELDLTEKLLNSLNSKYGPAKK